MWMAGVRGCRWVRGWEERSRWWGSSASWAGPGCEGRQWWAEEPTRLCQSQSRQNCPVRSNDEPDQRVGSLTDLDVTGHESGGDVSEGVVTLLREGGLVDGVSDEARLQRGAVRNETQT